MGGGHSKEDEQHKKEWAPDSEHSQCQLCETKFSLLRRRHHCRSCFRVLCAACSSHTSVLPELGYSKPTRICDQCKMRGGGNGGINAILGTTPRATNSSVGGGMGRSRSFDPATMGAASDGGRSKTPRAASSLAVIAADKRANTPRLNLPTRGGPSLSASGSNLGAGRPNPGIQSAGGNRPPMAPLSTAAPASKTAPIPPRYRSAVISLLFKSRGFATISDNAAAKANIGSALIGFLKQPSVWFDRAATNAHASCVVGDSSSASPDWTRVMLKQRIPSTLAGPAGSPSNSNNNNRASVLLVASPTLPSTRSVTLSLMLRCNNIGGNGITLPALRGIQVGIVHESCIAPKLRAATVAAVTSAASATGAAGGQLCTSVEAVSTSRSPAIGVSFEGRGFIGNKTEPLEFFRLQDNMKAVVVSIAFDQSSGSVAFSLCNANPQPVPSAPGSPMGKDSMSPTNDSMTMPPPHPSAGGNSNAAASASSSSSAHVLPVIAAYPCQLPSGVAGKWYAACSVDTTQIDMVTSLVAEWL